MSNFSLLRLSRKGGILVFALVLLLAAGCFERTDANSGQPSQQPEPVDAAQASQEAEPVFTPPSPEAFLEAQLRQVADLVREGRLQSAIHKLELCQQLFPDIPLLEAMRLSLVQRRDTAIARHVATNQPVINRSQLPASDRIAFALLIKEWMSPKEWRIRSMKEQEDLILEYAHRYPDFVEARLMQARIGLMNQERFEKLLAVGAVSATAIPTEGPEAAQKLAQWDFERMTQDPGLLALIGELKKRGWYHKAKHNDGGDPAADSTLERIRKALSSLPVDG